MRVARLEPMRVCDLEVRLARRYVLLLVLLVSGVGGDQASKAWANTRLATAEHPLLLVVTPDDEGKTVAQLAAELHGVDPAELETVMRAGYRPMMRFNPHARVAPDERAFGVSPVTGFRSLSYWVFCEESLDEAPRRYPRAADVATEVVAFNEATVGDYLRSKLSVAFGDERTTRIITEYVYSVDFTRVLPDDPVTVGDRYLLTDKTVSLIPGFGQLRYTENPGAAWGLLGSVSPGLRRTFFQVVTWLALAVIAGLFHRLGADQHLPAWALGLIMGGAIGNYIDRIRFNYVIDFIDFWAFGMHWPTFNVADVLISGGALLLVGEAIARRDRSYLLGRHSRPTPPPSAGTTPENG